LINDTETYTERYIRGGIEIGLNGRAVRDGQASVEEFNGMLIENNFKSDQELNSETLEALKRKFMTNHSHPALER